MTLSLYIRPYKALFVKRAIAFCLIILVSGGLYAQVKKPGPPKKRNYPSNQNKQKDFLQTQWWLGIRAGANRSFPQVTESWSAYSPLNYSASELNKSYETANLPGWFAGLDVTFYHKGFSLGFQPNIKRSRFTYSNDYVWQDDEVVDNQLSLNYKQLNNLDYIELPLTIKYDFTRTILRPHIMFGGYYSILLEGQKKIEVNGTDRASGAQVPFEGETIIMGVKDLYAPSTYGLLGGVGASYDVFNIRITLDVEYRYGLENIVNSGKRFSNNQLAGIGDAMDDLSLNDVTIAVGIVFPLRYISSDFNAIE